MNKKILLIFTIAINLFLISLVNGYVQVSPNQVEQGNNATITIYPVPGSYMDCSGMIIEKTTGNVVGGFGFQPNCDYPHTTKCCSQVSADFYVNQLYGEYFANIYDWAAHDFVRGDFEVIKKSCENFIKDGNETDVDCGGNKCKQCADNRFCVQDSDCELGSCSSDNKCGEAIDLKLKRKDKYSKREVFIVSDKNWKEVLKLAPLAIWNQDSEIIKYPVLVYHEDDGGFDFDSGIHFLQLYSPTHVTIFGETPKNLDKLLMLNKEISEKEIREAPGNYLGAGLKNNKIEKVSFKDYYSYWNKINEVVISEDNYETALMASVFASYKNAPLMFNDEISYLVLDGKKVYVIGEIDKDALEKISEIADSVKVYSSVEVQKEYIRLSDTKKVIVVNPNDLGIILEKKFRTEKSSKIDEVYSKNSLIAPFLASERNEVIISVNVRESPENFNCEDNQQIKDNFNFIDKEIEKQINFLFDEEPEYLTIIASPNSIPDSLYEKCHKTGYQYRNATDFDYAEIGNKKLKVGRIYGITSSDASAYVAREIFYGSIFSLIYGDRATGLSIGHSFEIYNDGAKKQSDAAKNSGYESVCYTGKKIESCINKVKAPMEEYSKKQFIIFGDHGFPNQWVDTLKSKKVPWLDLPYVFAHACSTNNYWKGEEDLMAARVIRKGAIAYHGATGISYSDGSENIALQKITSSNISLGELNKELADNLEVYKKDYLMIGDPVFEPNFRKINWSGFDFDEPLKFEEALDYVNNKTYIKELKTTKENYNPWENIIINVKVKNDYDDNVNLKLEYDIYSQENSYVSELQIQNIELNGSEEKEFIFSMEVTNTMPSGSYIAVVRLLNGEKVINEKEVLFAVENTLKTMDSELKICEDSSCEKESKVFKSFEKIYLGYDSDVSDVNINAVLVYPDSTEKDISLPYEFSSDLEGQYILKVKFSKEAYENNNEKLIFAISDENPILLNETCNENQVCDNGENYQNCLQDCGKKYPPEENLTDNYEVNENIIRERNKTEYIGDRTIKELYSNEFLNYKDNYGEKIIVASNKKTEQKESMYFEKEMPLVYLIIIIFVAIYSVLIIIILFVIRKVKKS